MGLFSPDKNRDEMIYSFPVPGDASQLLFASIQRIIADDGELARAYDRR
jgi:hypothetical protein